MQYITYEEIELLEDFDDIFNVASRYDVPLDGCDSCEDFVERITLHKQKVSGYHKHLLDHQRHVNLKKESFTKRQELCSIFRSFQENLQGHFQLLTRILESRGITNGLSRDLVDHIDSLKEGDCNIVIAGQTSAGKSALLNLLTGHDVLPKHVLSCTSSICKMRYGPEYKVKVTHGEKVSERTCVNQEEITEYLDNLVFEKELNNRAEGNIVPEVEIQLPADILKCGVTVVDTPGFGEYEAMDNLVKNFITRGRVAAFVYVIKTDSAGGVQEDRLVRFLKTFLENNKGQDQQHFNPRAALFVCNRWDLIEDGEKNEVRTNVLEKLKDVWPNLNESQVCFFSTTRAKASLAIDREYITKDLHHLLQSLNGLFVLAHQDAVKKSYGWMKNIMKQCTTYLKTFLSQLNMHEKDHEQKLDEARKQLEALRTRADGIIKEMKSTYEEATNTLIMKFKEKLSSRTFVEQVSDWKISDIPPIPSESRDMEIYKETMDSLIVSKILKLFDSDEVCWKFVSDLRSKILLKTKEQFRLLDEDMEDISTDLNGGSVRSSISSGKSASSEEEDMIMLVLKNKGEESSFVERIRTKAMNPGPIVSKTIARHICRRIVDVADSIIYSKMRRSSEANPKHIILERTNKVIDVLKDDKSLLRKFASRYTERLEHQIKSISWNIPLFILENETLMKEITKFRKKDVREMSELKMAMEHLEPLKELIRLFGYLHVKDFSSDDIMFHMDGPGISSSSHFKVDTTLKSSQSDVGSKRDVVHGLWTVVQKAELTVDEKILSIMVKCYNNPLQHEHLCKEIAKLRCLEHESIATFLGMTQFDNQSAFVFEGHMTSARLYLRRSTTDVHQAVPSLLMDLAEGLEALHRDHLVHMELTLDTVMVNENGRVKLCNIGLPRTCSFPPDTDAIDAADFTCLSPMVLKGEPYGPESDIYSFGIIVYEILMPNKPYEKQRSWKLSCFIHSVHASVMLNLDEQEMSEPLSELLRGCLLRAAGLRMPLIRIKEILKMFTEDTSLLNLRNLRNRIQKTSRTLKESSGRRPTIKRCSRSASAEASLVTYSEKEAFC